MCNAPTSFLANMLAELFAPIDGPAEPETYQYSIWLSQFWFYGPESTNPDEALRGFVDGVVDEALARAGGLALSLAVMAANSASHDLELLKGTARDAEEQGVTLMVETLNFDPDLPGNTRRADDQELQSVLEAGEELVAGVTLSAQGSDGDAELGVQFDSEGVAWGYSFWFLTSNGQEIQVKADTLEGLKARLFAAARDLRKVA